MDQVVHTTIRRADLTALIRSLPAVLTGFAPDNHGIAAGFRARLAFTFLGLVKEAFEVKGRGGTGSDGITWPPLKPTTMEQKATKGMSGSHGRRYKSDFGGVFKQLVGSMSAKEARQNAHIAASRAHERRMGKLIPSGPYQILVDNGILRNSLSVGQLIEVGPSARYTPPDSTQVFDESNGGQVTIGTNVPYAIYHHKGTNRNGKPCIPARPFWPEELPSAWMDEIERQTTLGLMRIIDLVTR